MRELSCSHLLGVVSLLLSLLVYFVDGQFSGITDNCSAVDQCPPIDIVFLMDTSSSMEEEAVSLCDTVENTINVVKANLSLSDIEFYVIGHARWGTTFNGTAWGGNYPCPPGTPYINSTHCDGSVDPALCPSICPEYTLPEKFRCLTTDVQTLYEDLGLTSVPGNSTCLWPTPATCGQNPSCPTRGNPNFGEPIGKDNQGEVESWASGSAVLAQHWTWRENVLKIIVPVSDEGPCNGGFNFCDPSEDDQWNFHGAPSCCNSTNDVSAVNNMINIALQNEVVVSPIMALTNPDTEICLEAFHTDIADQTGGIFKSATNSSGDLNGAMTEAVRAIIIDACLKFVWSCDDKDPCTIRDICEDDECVGQLCICDNNCEDRSEFSVPEDDVDNDEDEDDKDVEIGVGVGVSAVVLLACATLLVIAGIVTVVIASVVVAILFFSGTMSSGAAVIANNFVEGGAMVNPTFVGETTDMGNPLYN